MAKTKAPASPDKPPAAAPPGDAEYTVVARRYRPQQFADLIGQEHVARALTNAITSGRIAHAYLFTGARGTGKTSTARILAKALNCEKGPTPTPCDACDTCRRIADGDDLDAIEIDGASNNKAEEARELRSNIGFRPQRSRYKIYIIDEVHMLSNSAFNVLLKTLEEPPAHVKFIFATTEVQKLPITILSRCQRFDFAAISPAMVFETLKHIVAKEGLKADDDALQLVARRAGGSMRDAQTLLDQLLGFSDGTITAATVHALLGTAGDDRVAELADAILTHDAKAALDGVAAAAERGMQLPELLDQLVEYWRGLMLALAGGPDVLPVSPVLHDAIRKHAGQTTLDTVLAGLDVLTTAKARLRGSPHAQVLVEVAVVRLSRMDELLSVATLTQMLASGSVPATASQPARAVSQPTPAEPSKKNSLNGANGPASPPAVAQLVELTPETIAAAWERVLAEMGMVRSQQLRAAGMPAILGPNSLVLRFPVDYSSAYDACAAEAGLDALKAGLKRATGKDWQVRVEQTRVAAADPATVPTPGPQRGKGLFQLPMFQRAADVLGAQLVRVDDGFDPTAAVVAPVAPAAEGWDGDEPPVPAVDPDEV